MPAFAGTEDRAYSIADRVRTLLKSANDIDPAKVHLGRAYTIGEQEMPCLSVEIGEDTPLDVGQINSATYDSLLLIEVDIYHRQYGELAIAELHKQRSLIHFAVMADRTLGLSYVQDVQYAGAGRPLKDNEGGLPGYVMTVPFIVQYRFDVQDRTTTFGA